MKKDSYRAIVLEIVEANAELTCDCHWCNYEKGIRKHHKGCLFNRAKALVRAERKKKGGK